MFRKIRKIFHRGIKRDKFQIAKRSAGTLLLNYRNYIDRKILVDGNYEAEQFARFSGFAATIGAELFFDIGANIGLYTVQMARLPTVHSVLAFEPMAANRNQLHANILLNGLNEMVHVHSCALSDSTGSAVFLQNKGNSTGRSRLKETNTFVLDENKFEEITIKTQILDEICDLKDSTLAIKIDVEGHEMRVLRGMTQILKSNVCILQIECYTEAESPTDEYLAGMGYRLITTINADRYYSNSSLISA